METRMRKPYQVFYNLTLNTYTIQVIMQGPVCIKSNRQKFKDN